MKLTPLSQIVKLISNGAQAPASADKVHIKGIAVDTRLVTPQDLFFALPGANVDGHSFLGDAYAKGAAAAVVLAAYSGPDFGLPLIRVNNVLEALQGLALNYVRQSKSRIIAVTGSVGKTTTKDFITTLLKQKFQVASSPGNSNSQIGLPLAIMNHTSGDEDFLILEMGMTHTGQIAGLVKIAPPDYALITSVEYAHAVNFSSIDDIARAKAEIFSNPSTKLGFLPLNLPNFAEAAKTGSCRKLTFSTSSDKADYYLQKTAEGLLVHALGEKISLPPLNVPGQHNLHNLLAAIALTRNLNLGWEDIRQAIPKLHLPERRLQQVEKEGIVFINDSYNAIPVAVKAALTSLPPPKKGGKRIFAMGEMLELGEMSDTMHKEVGELALTCVDRVLCYGDACKPVVDCWEKAGRPSKLFSDFDELVLELKKHAKAGDIILLKGSRRKAMWRVLDAFGGTTL